MSRHLGLILVCTLAQVDIADKLVRMDMSFKMTRASEAYPDPMVNFKADGQSIYALVDTGIDATFFVWRKWYENNHQDCAQLIFGCYECIPPCKEGPTKKIVFADGHEVDIFKHTGKLDLNGGVSTSLDFGLVAAYDHDAATIWASLGLAASDPLTALCKSVIEQLYDKKIITGTSFSIYFTAGDNPSGELILGGDDPSKHAGPLSYVQIVDREDFSFQVLGLTIGTDPKNTIAMVKPACLDTGSMVIFMNRKFKSQVITRLQTAGEKKVQIKETPKKNLYISCSDAPNLPSMTFLAKGLKGEKVALVIPASNLVLRAQGDVCLVRVRFDGDDDVTLGVNAILGNYFYFDRDNNKIGFAMARRHLEPFNTNAHKEPSGVVYNMNVRLEGAFGDRSYINAKVKI
ncbi:hypothetical protein FOL47_007826 [Perkinsus chesapeaki]|uniref:Peptidase A1 domain-containing protein n=1 Tax=Perkinsus chesapeaki TaxID=330153 RepID=A0A7J6LI15_PERCH|nr:hypothetical protein FOL47_007826 [Perkinsus chesapeaki]